MPSKPTKATTSKTGATATAKKAAPVKTAEKAPELSQTPHAQLVISITQDPQNVAPLGPSAGVPKT